jgi:hypothetical protein
MPVGYAPAFCSCGNAAGTTCGLCQVGMCSACDVLSKPFTDLQAWPVRVAGFGYVNRVWDYRYRQLNLAHHDGGAYGPFLYLTELLASLASAHGFQHRNGSGPVRHLCWPCLYSAVPDTADRIADGLMCETPKCINDPCERCRCCQGAFCEACLTLVRPDGLGPCHISWTEPGGQVTQNGEVLHTVGAALDRSVTPTAPRGLCGICRSERHHRQKEVSEQIVREQYADVLVPAPDGTRNGRGPTAHTAAFQLPAVKRWTRQGRQNERARARAVLERCVAEITEQLERLPVVPCRRAWAFTQGLGYSYYVLLDERSRITPAAVPAS